MKIVLSLFLVVLMTSLVLADEVSVTPFQNTELPQITSSVQLDNDGARRKLLYCTWQIGDMGETAIPMDSQMCPPDPVVFNFRQNEVYFVEVDWVDLSYITSTNRWEIIRSGVAEQVDTQYVLDIPEPPQNILDQARSIVFSRVRGILCRIFPTLSICGGS